MKIYSLLLIVCCALCLLTAGTQGVQTINPKLPLAIRYKKSVPPDSIAEFLKICFTIQKIRVVDTAESRRIMKERLESLFTEQRELLQSKNWSLEKSQQLIEEAKKTPLNILVVQFFPVHSPTTAGYSLDSIDWQIRSADRDTASFYRYKPQVPGQPVFSVLKSFTDTVIASGLLR